MFRHRTIAIAAVLLSSAGSAPLTRAAVIDLTVAGSSYLGPDGSRFRQAPDGTVSLEDPFLRLQASTGVTTEQGFNTDFRPLPPDAVGITTVHSISLNTLAPRILTTPQGSYTTYTFTLDINESTTSGNSFLSLDELRIYTAAAPNIASSTDLATTGVLRYDMDSPVDQAFLMDALNQPGSGTIDLQIDVPTPYFASAAGTDYVYVFLRFGVQGIVGARNYGTSDGFEELRAAKLTATGVQSGDGRGAEPWIRALGAPSSADARFRYYAPGPGAVRMTLYDVRGRAVAAYEGYESAAGLHELPLSDLQGSARLSSGIYFYGYRWNQMERSGKITLIR